MIKATKRQLDILTQLAYYGYSNREIAQKLGIKEPTVKMHLSSLYKRMGVKNRVQLVEKARTFKLGVDEIGKYVYCVEEKLPESDSFEVFMVCSTEKLAELVKRLYSKNYKDNEYRITSHLIDDKRLIDMEA